MSTPRRYELTDFEWSIIQPLLPNKPRTGGRGFRRPQGPERHLLAAPNGVALGMTSRSAMGRPRPVRTGSGAGPRSASGIASSRPCRPPMTATCR